MAAAFRSAGVFSEHGSSTCDVPYPAGAAAGDWLMVPFAVAPGATAATPSGWTKLFGPINTSGSTNPCYVFWKIAGGSEPAALTITGVFSNGGGLMSAWSGVLASAPVNVSATAVLPTSGTTGTTPTVTTTVDDALLLRLYWGWGVASVTPAGTDTERYDTRYAGQDLAQECATSVKAVAGATGTTTATFPTTIFGGLGATIALAPGEAFLPSIASYY